MIEKKEIQYHYKNKKLKFSPDLESLYYDDYYKKSQKTVRIALILALILYSFFGVLDTFLAPKSQYHIWFIRYIIICPIIISVLKLSYLKIFKKYMQLILSITLLIVGFGILSMISLIIEVESGMYYYAGLILVTMWGYTFIQLKFLNATIVSWIVFIAYQFVAIFFQNVLLSEQLTKIYISNNFFFIGANIIGMFVSYSMEKNNRRDFLQRLMILYEQSSIERERNELKNINKIMKEELSMARKIQRQLIPHHSPKKYISFLYEPMEEVGGDLFDFMMFREKNKIGIFLSDVAGHGIPAALIASMVKTIIIQSGRHKEDPASLLMHLNNILMHKTDNYFITAFYGIYDLEKKTITFSSAGHNPPYLITKEGIKFLEGNNRLPLAVVDNETLIRLGKTYQNSVRNLEDCNKILMYTDGLIETRSKYNNKEFFYESIENILLDISKLPCEDFVNQLYGNLVNFQGQETFEDDICVVCIDLLQ